MEKVRDFDLSSSIIERVQRANKNIINDVTRYYLKENLEKMFGRDTFESDEIVLEETGIQNLVISTIFDEKKYVIYLTEEKVSYTDVTSLRCTTTDGQEVFTIVARDNIYTNQVKKLSDGSEYEYRYFAGFDNPEFKLSILQDNIEIYNAVVKALNSKLRQDEIFSLERIVPSENKSDSLLHRIITSLANDNIIRIPVPTGELCNYCKVASTIFEKMKEDASKNYIELNSSRRY